MLQYILLFLLFIVFVSARLYMFYTKYNKRRNLNVNPISLDPELVFTRLSMSYTKYAKRRNCYMNPKDIALKVVRQNDKTIKLFLDSIKNVAELNVLLEKLIDQIKEEWVKIKQKSSRDSSLIIDRYRQIAILEEVILLQHEVNKKDSMKVLEKFVHDNEAILTEIKDKARAKSYFLERDCKTLDRYYQDILSFFQKNK